MEPKLPAPNIGPEHFPSSYGQNQERAPSVATPENIIERGAEQFEQRGEQPLTSTTAAPILPPVTPILPPVPAADDSVTNTAVADDTPLVANDDDLIEKEWVDKAKKIIVETKDDPYRREQEVSKLQADYLLKRYGKELGASQ